MIDFDKSLSDFSNCSLFSSHVRRIQLSISCMQLHLIRGDFDFLSKDELSRLSNILDALGSSSLELGNLSFHSLMSINLK